MITDMNTKDILALTMIKGFGPATIKKYIYRLKTDLNCHRLVEELKPDESENIAEYEKKADSIIATCRNESIEIIDITSDTYPSLLLNLSNPPTILYIKGNKQLLNNTIIAIVGTRHSSSLGNHIAERLGKYFSQRFSICNGLVEGIDEHSVYVDGKILSNVIGVISGGLCYKSTCSKNHIRIIDDVLNNNGLIISELPPMRNEDRYSGSTSSRIQAGLSSGIILVQSKIDGGSKYTLDKFVKLNRVIGVVNYTANPEYYDEIFEANRIIAQQRETGLAKFVGLKTDKTLKVKAIIPISGKDDYKDFENQLTIQSSINLFDI